MDNQEPSAVEQETATGEHAESQENQESANTPPWERDGVDFDPAKAWNLIQNLRADNAKIKEANDGYKSQLKTYEDEKLSETERLQRDLEEAHQTIANYKKEQVWASIKQAHPILTDEDKALIGEGSEEAMTARAAKLAARLEQAQAALREAAPQPIRHPLTGGTNPATASSTDWLRDAMTN